MYKKFLLVGSENFVKEIKPDLSGLLPNLISKYPKKAQSSFNICGIKRIMKVIKADIAERSKRKVD